MLEMRIHGYGGQGIVTLAQMLAAAALKTGKQVQALPSFGVERRGAPVVAAVRIDDNEIWARSQSYQPDLVLVLSSKLLDMMAEQGLKDDSQIILNAVNKDDIPVQYSNLDIKIIDITGLAVDNGLIIMDVPSVNVPSFGAFGYAIGLPLDKIQEVIMEKWPGEIGAKSAQVAAKAYEIMQGRG
jgi:pyruvate ferredoxin oxidoreductase gamma subunit